MDAVSTWNFKPYGLSDGDLFLVATILFDGLLNSEGLAELEIDRDQLNRLLFAIRAMYHAPNPYHNYIHAVDVLQATYSFLVLIGVAPPFEYIRDRTAAPWKRPEVSETSPGFRRARQVLRPQDVLAILVAAMGHDAGHPGLSNAFMKNANTPLSQVYEDKSVLENMHCMLMVQLLRKHGFGFLIDLPRRGPTSSIASRASFDSKGFRHLLYSSVLATDMSLHFAWIQDLQNLSERITKGEEEYSAESLALPTVTDERADADRVLIAQAFIKCADISNPTRPIEVSTHWSTVLLTEWAVQASLETDLSLPVSVIASADVALQAKGQIGFIKLFTQPLFNGVSDILPEMKIYAERCAENHATWTKRLEDCMDSTGADVVQPAIQDAADNERFATLFPLSLPLSLVGPNTLEPGPSLLIAPPASTSSTAVSAPASAVSSSSPFASTSQSTEATSAHAHSNPHLTPKKDKSGSGYENSTCARTPTSPAAKAIRAVYHANLLSHKHNLSSWRHGLDQHVLASRTILTARRSSTPGILG